MAIYQAANLVNARPTIELDDKGTFSFAPKINEKSHKLDVRSNLFVNNKSLVKIFR